MATQGIDTGGALRPATYSEAVEALTAGLESEAFADVHVTRGPSVSVTLGDGLTQYSVQVHTVRCREATDGPVTDVAQLLTFDVARGEDAPALLVRWVDGDSDTDETAGEREAMMYAEITLRARGATMLSPRITMLDPLDTPAGRQATEQGISESDTNTRAHAVVQHMMALLRNINLLHGATQRMSEATDARN